MTTQADRTPPTNSDAHGNASPVDDTDFDVGLDLESPEAGDFDDPGLVLDLPVIEDLSGEKPKKQDVVERQPKVVDETPGQQRQGQQQQQTPAQQAPQGAAQQTPGDPQQTPATPPTQTAPAQPQEDFITHLVANRGKYIESLSKNHFAPTEAELGLLESDPKTFFGNLRAQIYVDTLLAQSQIMKEALPRIIQQQVGQINNESAHENAFFSRHPDLNKAELQTGLVKLAETIRATRPDFDREQFMDALANSARTLWGLPAPQQATGNGRQGNTTRQRINGFQPAVSKPSTTGRPTQQQQPSQVDALFDLMRADDID